MRMTRMVRALLLAVVAATISVRPAVGQEMFKESQAEVDLSTYTNVFDCMAALGRVKGEVGVKEFLATGIWRDTLPYDPKDKYRAYPAVVGETARTCLEATAKDAASAPLVAWSVQASLYLDAGMVDSARAAVERRLNAVKPDSADQLVPLFTELLYLYERRRPSRLELADEIVLANVGRIPKLDGRLHVYMQMMVTGSDDPTRATEAAARTRRLIAQINAQLDSLAEDAAQGLADRNLVMDDMRMTPAKARERIEGMASFYYGTGNRLKNDLSVSTKAFDEATRKVYSQASGQPPEAYPWPLGQPAPRLEGDVWLGCEQDPCEAYPRKGRVSVVAFHQPEARQREQWELDESSRPELLTPLKTKKDSSCAERAIALRRLQDRFPEIDIIVVSRTLGHYHYAKEEVTPEREAELVRDCFKSNGLDRVVVTMTKTPGFRLPEPDGRLAKRPTANWTNYSFGGVWRDNDRQQHGSDLIVDQDGYVLNAWYRRVARYAEENFAEVIKVLLEREKAKT